MQRGAKEQMLLLDEATAHVDERTAARLREVVARLRGRRTVVIIAHRLEDVAVCDTVAVLAGGRLVEHGPPLALLDRTPAVPEDGSDGSAPAAAAAGAGGGDSCPGAFAAMAAELGSAVEARIRILAAEAEAAARRAL